MDVALKGPLSGLFRRIKLGQGANHVAIEAMYICVRGAQIPFCSHPGESKS